MQDLYDWVPRELVTVSDVIACQKLVENSGDEELQELGVMQLLGMLCKFQGLYPKYGMPGMFGWIERAHYELGESYKMPEVR